MEGVETGTKKPRKLVVVLCKKTLPGITIIPILSQLDEHTYNVLVDDSQAMWKHRGEVLFGESEWFPLGELCPKYGGVLTVCDMEEPFSVAYYLSAEARMRKSIAALDKQMRLSVSVRCSNARNFR